MQLYNDNPNWQPSTAWLHDPGAPTFTAYRTLVGLSSSIPHHYVIDLDGNIRFARQGGLGDDKTIITNVLDELL